MYTYIASYIRTRTLDASLESVILIHYPRTRAVPLPTTTRRGAHGRPPPKLRPLRRAPLE